MIVDTLIIVIVSVILSIMDVQVAWYVAWSRVHMGVR